MTDPLDLLWAVFEAPQPLFTADSFELLPPGFADALIAQDLLVRAASTNYVMCPNCDERHVEEVVVCEGPDGRVRYFIYCPESLRVEISPELMLQWQPDFQALARKVKELLGIEGRARDRISNQLWRLGTVEWKKQPREVFMARGLTWPNGREVAAQCASQSRPIVLIGHTFPPAGCWPTLIPAVVPLPSVITSQGGKLHLDTLLMARLVEEADLAARMAQSASQAELGKRIDQLVEQRMAEGPINELIAAGVSQGMSAREIEGDLAERGIQKDHSTIARRLQKVVKSRGNRSSSSILKHASSQPRDRRGRSIADAQPADDE